MKLNFILLSVLLSAGMAYAQNSDVQDIEAKIVHGQFNGHRNFVKNPTCRKNVRNITPSSTAAAKNTTDPLDGISDCTWNPTASTQTLTWALDSFSLGLKGQNCEARVFYSGDASLVKAYVKQGSTQITTDLQLGNSGSTSSVASILFPCGDGVSATTLELASTGDAASVKYSTYVGRATNVGTAAPSYWLGSLTYAGIANCSWTVASTTFVAPAADTDCNTATTAGQLTAPGTKILAFTASLAPGVYRIVLNIPFYQLTSGEGFQCRLVAGSTNSSIHIHRTRDSTNVEPSDLMEFNLNLTEAYSGSVGLQCRGQTTSSIFLFPDNTTLQAKFDVYYLASASAQTVRMDQSNYDWVSYTPTFTGFGTVTSPECQHKRDGADLMIRCKATTGTTTATEARISLPGSLVSADTNKIPSIQNAGGLFFYNANGALGIVPLIEPSTAYLTFGLQTGSSAGLAKANGSALIGNTIAFTFFARVPIQGWTENQNAPLLVGGVTSNYAGLLKVEAAEVNCDATSSITASTDFLTSVGNRSGSSCALTIKSGMFSATPYSCQVTVKAATVQATACSCASATSCTIYGAAADYDAYVSIMGPR